MRRVAGIVVPRLVVNPAVVAVVAWRPVSTMPVGAIVIVNVVVIVRVGIIGCR